MKLESIRGMTKKQQREKYIKESVLRVSQWPVWKQNAFYTAVERATGEPKPTQQMLSADEMKAKADKLIDQYNDERWDRALAFRDKDGIEVYDEDDDYIGKFTDEKFIEWMCPYNTGELND